MELIRKIQNGQCFKCDKCINLKVIILESTEEIICPLYKYSIIVPTYLFISEEKLDLIRTQDTKHELGKWIVDKLSKLTGNTAFQGHIPGTIKDGKIVSFTGLNHTGDKKYDSFE